MQLAGLTIAPPNSYHLLFVFAGLMLVAPQAVSLTDYQREQITRYLDSPKMQQDTVVFDGVAFSPEADLRTATDYYNSYIDSMNRALRGWKMLSSSDAGSAEGQALFARLEEKLAWAQAMQQAYPEFRAGKSGQNGTAATTQKKQSTTSGGMTDYQKQIITKHLDSESMRQDKAIFDGQDFVAGVPFQTVDRYYNGYLRSLKNAIGAWNGQISSSARSTADGQELARRLAEASAWAEAMNTPFDAAREANAQQQQTQKAAREQAELTANAQQTLHKQQCVAFQNQAMTPQNRDPVNRLINQLQHGNSQITSAEGVQKHRGAAQEVLNVCKSVDYATLTARPCWFVVNRPAHDPRFWCNAAARADQLIKAAALNSARQSIAVTGAATIQSPAQLRENDGWLTFEGPVTFKEKLFFSAHGREAVMANVSSLLNAAGIENAESELWKEQRGRLDALRHEVESTAGSWKTPADKADNYSTALARGQVAEMHPQADVRTAFLSRASYKIHKNALGVPLRRTMPGYVLFRLPEDPFCQLRSYTLTEQYSGGGLYQQAAGVRFGYVRFQACP
ncbi:MAG: hypothetical protein OET44_10760 [Gammaproteobacteria bacterium]|nr:hypothetical protein [Gammaproteobacteria bacterium]